MTFELSDEQAQAVAADGPRVLVAASAGSGKTRVLTARFVRRVVDEGAGFDAVAAVTFTDKAAGELTQRIREALLRAGRAAEARQAHGAWVSTIHGLCRRILFEHGIEAGVDPGARVLVEHEAASAAEEAFAAALDALSSSDGDVAALLDSFDAFWIAKLAIDAHGRAIAAGLDPREAAPAGPVDPRRLSTVCARLREAAQDLAAFSPSQTRDANIQKMREAAGLIEKAAQALGDQDLVIDVLDALGGLMPKAQVRGDQKDLVYRAKAVLEEGKALLAQAACAPYERAMARLIGRFADEYRARKDAMGAVDFEDLQTAVASLLETRPDIARAYQERLHEVLVDEFQDTNRLQRRILEALAGGSMVAVGDERQSIYRFRFADVQVFRDYARAASSCQGLTDNWRSHPDVLDVVNHVFSDERLFGGGHARLRAARREPAAPWPCNEPRVRVMLVEATSSNAEQARQAEADAIAREVERLHLEHGVALGQIAILFRALKNRARRYEQALRARGLAVVSSSGNLFDAPEAIDALMLLRVVDNTHDEEALTHILSSRLAGLGPAQMHRLKRVSGDSGLWAGLSRAEEALDGRDLAAAVRLREAVNAARSLRGDFTPGEILLEAMTLCGYSAMLASEGAAGEHAWENVELVAALADTNEAVTGGGILGFVRHANMLRRFGKIAPADAVGAERDAVQIMSIHAAKGLEFPVVILADALGGSKPQDGDLIVDVSGERPLLAARLPKRVMGTSCETEAFARLKAAEEAAERDEAKRLLYVALTRAQEALYITASIGRRTKSTDTPSAGVFEALGVSLDPVGAGRERRSVGSAVVEIIRLEAAEPGGPEMQPAAVAAGGEPSGELLRASPGGVGAALGAAGRVSPSALEEFERCPYRYYAAHVLGLRDLSAHEDSSAIGTAVHEALREVLSGFWRPERMDAIAQRHGLGDEARERVARAADRFARSELLERLVGFPLVRAEEPFALPLGPSLLVGRMDAYATDGRMALIADFKMPALPEPPGGSDWSLCRRQMACYGLAALKAGRASVEAVIYDASTGETAHSWLYEQADAEGLESEISELLARIGEGKFEPLPSYRHEACVGCPALDGVCPVRAPHGRRVGGAARRLR